MGSLTRCSRVRLPMGPQYRTGLPEAGSEPGSSVFAQQLKRSAQGANALLHPGQSPAECLTGGQANSIVRYLDGKFILLPGRRNVQRARIGVAQHVRHGFLDHAVDSLRQQPVDLVQSGIDARGQLRAPAPAPGRSAAAYGYSARDRAPGCRAVATGRGCGDWRTATLRPIAECPARKLQARPGLAAGFPSARLYWRGCRTAAGRVRRAARVRCPGVRRPAATRSCAAGCDCPGSIVQACGRVHWPPRLPAYFRRAGRCDRQFVVARFGSGSGLRRACAAT